MRRQTQSPFLRLLVTVLLVSVGCQTNDTPPVVTPSVWCAPPGPLTMQVEGPIDECGTGPNGGPTIDGGNQLPADAGTLEDMKLSVDGLWTNPNPLGGQRPPGALGVADDIVIDSPGQACPRRADDNVGVEDVDPGILNQGWDYGGYMFAWSADSANNGLFRATVGATINWDSVGSLSSASPAPRLPFATSAGYLYVLTNAGPYVLDGPTATPAVPGVAPAPDLQTPNPVADATLGWLQNNEVVAYKVVFGKNDADGRPVLGEPSGMNYVVAPSSGGPFHVDVIIDKPAEVSATSGHFVQVYRTPSATSRATLGDSYFLVWEKAWNSASAPFGQMTVTDVAAAGELPLYTNPDRGGVRSNNVRPPLAEDVTPFRNRLWLANTTSKQTLTLRIIAPPDPLLGYSVTIAGTGYVLDVPTGSTVSEKIESAARYLVTLLGSNANVTATYASGPNDPPGIITLTAKTNGAAAFTAQALIGNSACGALFIPNITTAQSSVVDDYPNRLHFSKDGLPYAFPLPNTLTIGAQEHGISRIVALRDALLVFKERGGDGLWKVTPSGASWYVEQVNSSVQLVSSDALTVVDNTIFAMTEDGIVAVTEAGVEDIDIPIEDKISALMLERANAMPYVKAFGREALGERKVYFGFPTASVSGDGTDVMADTFVYNLNTQTWTKDRRLWQGAYVNSGGQMVRFTGEGDVQNTYLERISGDALADRLGVDYSIAWNVETAENPGAEKQFYQVAVLTKEAQPASTDVYMYFTADDGEQSSAVETGGDGSNYIRAEVPWDRQRTSRLVVEMRGTVVNPINIVGMSATYRQYGGSLVGR